MSKSKWVETLKSAGAKEGHAKEGHAKAVYRRKQQNLALSDADEPLDDADEWTFAKEVYGQDVDVIHPIELRHEIGIASSLQRDYDLTRCYTLRIYLKTPHVILDTIHVLPQLFPAHVGNGAAQGGRGMTILGFDNFFRSIDHGCSVFDMYMHDGQLDLTQYAGNYGGRGNLRPRDAYYPLTVGTTPEWIWTPEKP